MTEKSVVGIKQTSGKNVANMKQKYNYQTIKNKKKLDERAGDQLRKRRVLMNFRN